jgi:hypothetical protein
MNKMMNKQQRKTGAAMATVAVCHFVYANPSKISSLNLLA